MSDIQYFTEKGLQKLKDELEHLKSVERPKVIQQIAEARDKGDLSENAEYDAAKEAQGHLEDRINKLEAIINSMTKKERKRPDIIKGSRKKRIAAGSGTQIQDVNRLLKQFTQMQKMMKKMSQKGGLAKMMRGLGGRFPMGGGLPF